MIDPIPTNLSTKHMKKYCTQLMITQNRELLSQNTALRKRIRLLEDSLYEALTNIDILTTSNKALRDEYHAN